MFNLVIRNKCAVISIDDFSESIPVNYKFWKNLDYERSWVTALSKAIVNNKTSIALITDMNFGKSAGDLTAWIVTRRGSRVVVSQSVFSDKIGKIRFDEYGCLIVEDSLVGKYSKWECGFNDIFDYSRRQMSR